MEDSARLALIEQNVGDSDKFEKIMYQLLKFIYQILENPHDYELRTISGNGLENILQYYAIAEYLKHVGFQIIDDKLTYAKENSLSQLKIAQAAIERKIHFCYGPMDNQLTHLNNNNNQLKKPKLKPEKILNTHNGLLLKIEDLFNTMIKYEDEKLQEFARQHIPILTLQLMALDRMREHQKNLKAGKIKGHDMSFDIALIMELLGWFKYKFFSWMDKPACEDCGGPTQFVNRTFMTTKTEKCALELYKCTVCPNGKAKFPRYNDVRMLLTTRRGRCGEWANCFTLLCRSLGYDTRYVYDTTDHVWCEIFNYETNSWMHVDPCEAKLNTPLMYSHGWGKKLSYVIALSRDDLQDVTWRYTSNHKEVLKRRNECEESELVQGILTLREHRQRQVSDARRRYLTKRCLEELVQLMVERKPTDYESHGRISGSKEWRTERGEMGSGKGHVFEFTQAGNYGIRYYTASDKYRISCDDTEQSVVNGWLAGVYESKCLFRKVENDWRMVYLAREEGAPNGSITWKLSANDAGISFHSLSIRLTSMLYEDGKLVWKVKFDDADAVDAELGESPTIYERQCKEVFITAELSGGKAELGWQHAQLFRQSLDSKSCTLEILAVVGKH